MSHVTRHASHVTRHTSHEHVTRHTSHVARHTSHVTRHSTLTMITCDVNRCSNGATLSAGVLIVSAVAHTLRALTHTLALCQAPPLSLKRAPSSFAPPTPSSSKMGRTRRYGNRHCRHHHRHLPHPSAPPPHQPTVTPLIPSLIPSPLLSASESNCNGHPFPPHDKAQAKS